MKAPNDLLPSMEAVANLLESLEVAAALEGNPYQWSPADTVRMSIKVLSAAPTPGDTEFLQWIRDNCKVLYWPPNHGYPIEHKMHCLGGKDGWRLLQNAALQRPARDGGGR